MAFEEIYKSVPYYGDNERIRSQIAFVLLKVPEPVRNFAYQQCLFSSLDEQRAGTCTKLTIRPGVVLPPTFWLIELSETIYLACSLRYYRYSCSFFRHHIAHELAHAYLNHDGIYSEDKARQAEREDEAEADRLAKQWGFEPPACVARTCCDRMMPGLAMTEEG